MTSPYMTGTVSVTAGSAVVTGTGTAWQTALIAGGLFGLDSDNGNPVPILSIDGDTQLTLAKPWRGTTAANQAYWIVRDTAYLQQLSANAQALAAYIQRLDNTTLATLAALIPAADKLPYFTGAETATVMDFKAAARSLLTLAAASDKLPYFTGSEAAGLTDFKASARSLLALTAAADKLPYFTDGNAAALADVTAHGRAILGLNGGAGKFPRSTGANTAVMQDIVGAVAQAAGIPTGAIIERGSNANGEYVRFADGTQYCWNSVDDTAAAWATANGQLFSRSAFLTVTYPIAFASGAPVQLSGASSYVSSLPLVGLSARNIATTAANVLPWSSISIPASTAKLFTYFVSGRWFI
jgi:hypothetical protein